MEALKPFEKITDPRSEKNLKHPLKTLIGTTLLASLAGIDSFSGFADFTEAHFEMLKNYFDFPYGLPSHDTYQRLWDAIAPQEFYSVFSEFTGFLTTMKSNFINLDGKTICNSGSEKALHIVSAWCQANQLVLAQARVDSN